jgi:hypothetical protein
MKVTLLLSICIFCHIWMLQISDSGNAKTLLIVTVRYWGRWGMPQTQFWLVSFTLVLEFYGQKLLTIKQDYFVFRTIPFPAWEMSNISSVLKQTWHHFNKDQLSLVILITVNPHANGLIGRTGWPSLPAFAITEWRGIHRSTPWNMWPVHTINTETHNVIT